MLYIVVGLSGLLGLYSRSGIYGCLLGSAGSFGSVRFLDSLAVTVGMGRLQSYRSFMLLLCLTGLRGLAFLLLSRVVVMVADITATYPWVRRGLNGSLCLVY